MGYRAMEWVWDNYHGQGSKKLVMLAIAFHATEQNICDLPMPQIAKMAEITERQCRVIVSELLAEDSIAIIRGGGRTPNRYSIIGYEGDDL